MRNLFALLLLLVTSQTFSQEKSDCDERTLPYWANGINSHIEGEKPALRKAFAALQATKTGITPANGFITLRLNISKTGQLCDMETFEIDTHYKSTAFNNGELIQELEQIALGLTNWQRDKAYKTYNLIKFKIKDGRIEEIF
ncbi:MAG: hypothetical protein KJO73_01405 [Croceitalea sp.]|nr:hypothetical protein [Croceitalea sp.]